MRVVAITGHGDLDRLEQQTWPDPEPGRGEALVEVKACGLNHLDMFVLRGMPGLLLDFIDGKQPRA